MRCRKLALVAFFLALAATAPALAQVQPDDCQSYISGKVQLEYSGLWGATDSGVITDRFVVPVDKTGAPMKVQHGVDLSGYNSGIDYHRLATCGATFAFVRLERPAPTGKKASTQGALPAFQQHVRGLRQAGIGVIPTYDFQRDKRFRQVATYVPYKGKLELLESSVLMDDARAHGRALARQFLTLLKSSQLPEVGTFSVRPVNSRFFAIDVEEDNRPVNDAHLGAEFGMVYAATIVAFALEVQKTDPKLVPVMYTSLNTYSSYLSDNIARADDLALSTYPAWVVRVLPDGREAYPMKATAKIDKQAQRFCVVAGGDRCIFQQYSHRALIGYGLSIPYKKPVPPAPSHHDIDRLFSVKTCTIGVGQVLVRDDAERSRCL